MRRWPFIALLVGSASCLFPSPDANHLYVCAANTDCPSTFYCDAGSCTALVATGADAGACVARDGGALVCAAGLVCDLGACFPSCSRGCANGEVCDAAVGACVPFSTCTASSGCPNSELCLASVCTAPPLSSGIDAGCAPTADAGHPATVTIKGQIAVFPGQSVSGFDLDGGSVTLLFDGGAQMAGSISYTGPVPGYSIQNVPVGPVTAVVTANGLVPTYFPGLQITSVGGELDFDTVVTSSFVASPPGDAGFGALPGQLVWVGQALDCAGDTVGGFTVGLSPAAAFLGYYDAGNLSSTLTASSATLGGGEFAAFGAPYAQTDYVLALPWGPLIRGTFTPPAFNGGAIAVAIIYPNFSQ